MSQLILAGAIAGGLGGIAGNPADIVLVRMTSDVTLPLEKQRRYRHALDGVVRLVREEGVSALARGIVPNTVGLFVNFSHTWSDIMLPNRLGQC